MFLLLFVEVFSLSRFDVESGPGNFFDEFFLQGRNNSMSSLEDAQAQETQFFP